MDREPPSPDDFATLRRLLALKRHERPPPGYFEDFSARVMARIAAEEEVRARSWWSRIAEAFSPQRLLLPANALTACGLVFVGASLYLVVGGRRPALQPSPTRDSLAGGNPARSRWPSTPAVAGVLPSPTPPPLEHYTVLRLEPVTPESDTNTVPRDLFTLPTLRSLQGAPVGTPTLLLEPR